MAEEGSSLEELLRGVPPEKLDQPCQDDHLCEVARHVTDWPYLAPFLGISRAEMEEIRGKWPFSVPGQRIEFLAKWQEKRGRKATYRRLCKAFYKAADIALTEKVCEVVVGQGSSSSEGSEDEDSSPLTEKEQSESMKRGPSFTLPHSTAPLPPSEVHPLDLYTTYLRDMYGRIRPQFLLDQWPPPPTRKVFNLSMVHSKDVQCGPINTELVRLLQKGNIVGYTGKRVSVQLCDLFELDDEDRKIVLIEGAPGSGKSTLAWHACQRWKAQELFQDFRMVVFVQLRDPRVQSAQSIADLLPAGSEERKRDAAEGIRACEGRGVLFVMDGWDEFGPGLKSDSIVSKLISKSDELEVPYSTLLITSRPIASAVLQPLASSRVEIVGFTPEEVSLYFQEAVEDPIAVQALQEQLKELPVIEASCYLPLNAAIVAHLFKGLNHTLPRTLHGVFSELVCGCIIRHLTKQSGDIPVIRSLDKLPREAQAPFESVCLLAYEASMKNKVTFSDADLTSYGGSVKGSGLGLMQGVQSFLSGKSYSYHFLHLSVQELLAAVHVSKLGAGEQVSIFRELFSQPRLVAMFQFYAALTKLETEGIREVVANVLSRPSEEDFRFGRSVVTQWRQHVVNILHCLYEAQDESLCLFVASLLGGGLDLFRLTLSPLDCLCIGYFLRCMCVGREGEFSVRLYRCGLDSYSVGFIMKELGKCAAGSGEGSSNAVLGCLGLDLGRNNIDGSGVRLVCELMRSNPSVITRLDLSESGKIQGGEDGFLCLLQVLCSNHCLVELNLFHCNLRITSEVGPVFVEMLHNNVSLKVLELRSNFRIGGAGLGYVVEGMVENSGVARLGLAVCTIKKEGGKLLCRMLTENRTLEHLHIGWNDGLGDAGIMEVAEGLKANSRLEKLSIWGCGYTLECLKEFVLCLKENSHLRTLEVWDKGEVDSVEEERAAVNALRSQHGVKSLEISKR